MTDQQLPLTTPAPRVVTDFEKYGAFFERFGELTKRGLLPAETTRYIDAFAASGVAPRVLVEAGHRLADRWDAKAERGWPSPERVITKANQLLSPGGLVEAPDVTARREQSDRQGADAEFGARKRRVVEWRAASPENEARFREESKKLDREIAHRWAKGKDPYGWNERYRAAFREGSLVGIGLALATKDSVPADPTVDPSP